MTQFPNAILGEGPAGLAAAARQVHLVLPETGVCSGAPLAADCGCAAKPPAEMPLQKAACRGQAA